jgi:hypothetical protein
LPSPSEIGLSMDTAYVKCGGHGDNIIKNLCRGLKVLSSLADEAARKTQIGVPIGGWCREPQTHRLEGEAQLLIFR